MKLYYNINEVLTLKTAYQKQGRHLEDKDIDILKNAAIVFDEESILWVGEYSQLPSEYQELAGIDLTGHCITPELVDSHTHLVFGGNRSDEYTMRLNGADYQAIAESGGGILATMNGTNSSSDEELFQESIKKIEAIYELGVGTIEIKSGYALTYEGEKRVSTIINRLKEYFSPRIQIHNTFLAAHAVPKEYSSSQEYLREVVIPLLKELAPKGILDSVDIFHESGYFTEDDTRELFNLSHELGIPTKIHADEFGDNNGASIASKYKSLSADHLLCSGEKGIQDLANSSTVATLLPGTGWFLGKTQANAKNMLKQGCRVAIASDYNPGSCHCYNLLLIASMAAPMYPLNISQLWAAITLNASAALGLSHQGAIIKGLRPRFTIFKCNNISEITYSWGQNLVTRSF